jgi:hypothetical protein
MKAKTISELLVTLVIASMLFSVIPVMAAPTNAVDMNPNVHWGVLNPAWLEMDNGAGVKRAWLISNGAVVKSSVRLDTAKLEDGAVDALIAHGWGGPSSMDGFLYKMVQLPD